MYPGGKIDRVLTIIEGRERNNFMTGELLRAAKDAGFTVNQIKSFDEDKVMEGRLGEDITDLVLWRGPVDYSSAALIDRVQAWMNHNCLITVNTDALGGRMNTSNKMYQHGSFQLDPYVAEHILPMYPALSKANILRLVEQKKIFYPFVLKPDLGVRGEGILLIEKEADLDKFNKKYLDYSVEQYVQTKYNWRTFMIGGVAIGDMRKTGNDEHPEDFVIKSGGFTHEKETNVEICEELNRIATRAAAASNLQYAGIDLVRDDNTGRYIILETNVSGGWQNGYRKSTGIDIPSKIMEWFNDRIELFEKPTRVAVSNYVTKRLQYISRDAQEDYRSIVDFKLKIERDREICNFDIEMRDMPLIRKLSSAYVLVQNNDLTEMEWMKLRMFIAEVEKYEISKFGNFIGKDSGVLEDAIKETALYLAISSKM